MFRYGPTLVTILRVKPAGRRKTRSLITTDTGNWPSNVFLYDANSRRTRIFGVSLTRLRADKNKNNIINTFVSIVTFFSPS